MAKARTYAWKNPALLTTAVTLVMIFYSLRSAAQLAVWMVVRLRSVIDVPQDQLELVRIAAQLNAQLVIPSFLLLIVPFFWILRVSKNAHVLKGQKLRNSPMFSALWWYIIPLMSLFKPYESLEEIWDVSGTGPIKRRHLSLLIWWGSALIAWILGDIIVVLSGYPFNTDHAALIRVYNSPISPLSFAISIVKCLAFIAVALKIASIQVKKRLGSGPSDVHAASGILERLTT